MWVKNFQHPRSMFVMGEFLVKLTEPNYQAFNLGQVPPPCFETRALESIPGLSTVLRTYNHSHSPPSINQWANALFCWIPSPRNLPSPPPIIQPKFSVRHNSAARVLATSPQWKPAGHFLLYRTSSGRVRSAKMTS